MIFWPNMKKILAIIVVFLASAVTIFFLSLEYTSTSSSATETPIATLETSPGTQSNAELARHDTYITFSTNAATFTEGTRIATSASVPDVVICTQDSAACDTGDILVYFVNTASKTAMGSGVAMIRSPDDGKLWSDRVEIDVADRINKGPVVDPSIVQLDNGALRIYFYGPDAPLSQVTDRSTLTSKIYSATSQDGVYFTLDEGVRLSRTGFMTDPEVIATQNGWLMYYSLGIETGVATSINGLDFTDLGEIDANFGGVPGAVALSDGTVRTYGCQQKGVMSAISQDGIRDFTIAQTALDGLSLCDPSVLEYPAGQYVMVYKKVREE